MKLLITGASGYIGCNLLAKIPADWEVYTFGLDAPTVDSPAKYKFIKGSITNKDDLDSAFKDIDVVLHLAAIKGCDQCAEDYEKTIAVNIFGTRNVVCACRKNNVKKLVFASSYWVYGTAHAPPFTEESIVAPDEIYGISKAISENEIKHSGLNYVILRFSNIFGLGVGTTSDDVVFNFVSSAFEGKPITLSNGGSQKLDLINITDACAHILRVLSDENISNGILNIGRGEPISVAALAQTIKEIFLEKYGRDINIITHPKETEETNRWLSVNKLSKICPLTTKTLKAEISDLIAARETQHE